MRAKAALYNILAGYSNIIYSLISGLVLVPFYLSDFGAEVYGVWLATGNLVVWLGVMGGALSIVFAQNTAIAHAKGDTEYFRDIVGSGFFLFFLLSAFIFGGVILVSKYFLQLFNFDQSNYQIISTALKYSALAASISLFHSLLVYILGAWFKTAPILLATIIGGGVSIGVNITLLYLGFGLLSIPLSLMAKAIIMFLLLARAVFVEWRKKNLGSPRLRLGNTIRFAKSSGPIIISNVAGIGINHSQATIIGFIFGPTAATIVSVTDKLYSLVKSFIYPVGNALLQPLSSMVHNSEEFDQVRIKYIHPIDYLALMSILICLAFNQAFITLWVGDDFYGGDLLSIALAFAAFLIIRVNILVSVLNAKGLFKITSWYMVLDLTIRFVALCGLFYLIGIKHISVLPLAECVGILIATKVTLSKHLKIGNNASHTIFYGFSLLLLCGYLSYRFTEYSFYSNLSTIVLTALFLIYASWEVWKSKILNHVRSQFIK